VYELWRNIGTNFISKLKEDPRFPSNPDKMEVLPNFESAKNFANNYGARLKTYYRVRIYIGNSVASKENMNERFLNDVRNCTNDECHFEVFEKITSVCFSKLNERPSDTIKGYGNKN
jgi:O-glycosyl hydrolase